ncbi:11809_t:CDS:1, partial [Gigaspora rosea]
KYPTVPILAMTATLAYEDIILLYDQLQFNSNNIATIQSETLIRNELTYEVIKKKDCGNSVKNDLITLINQITKRKTIIYCANQQCNQVIEMLVESLNDKIIDILLIFL